MSNEKAAEYVFGLLPICNFCQKTYDPFDVHTCPGNQIIPRKGAKRVEDDGITAELMAAVQDTFGQHPPCTLNTVEEVQEIRRRLDAIPPRVPPDYPDNNPKTAFGAVKTPVDLVPTALMNHVAQAFANGAGKYGPYNWRTAKISSSVYYAAAMRHLMAWWEGEEVAADSGVHHLGHAAACMAMILDTMHTDLLNDNRPPVVERK